MQNFQALGAPPPDPRASGGCPKPLASGGWGLRLQTPIGLRRLGAPPPDPQTAPPLRISGYAPEKRSIFLILHLVARPMEGRSCSPLSLRYWLMDIGQDALPTI